MRILTLIVILRKTVGSSARLMSSTPGHSWPRLPEVFGSILSIWESILKPSGWSAACNLPLLTY